MIRMSGDPLKSLHARGLLVCVLAAGVLGACGGDSRSAERSKPPLSSTTTAPTTTTAAAVSYQVKRGDSLTAIAAFFGLSTTALAQANQLDVEALLIEGQVLTIPPLAPPQLTITPEDGPAGETFMFSLTGAKAGEIITFTIDGPGPDTFTGSPHTASPEGTVTTRYESSGDEPGTYTVVATGDRGTSLQTSYRLGP